MVSLLVLADGTINMMHTLHQQGDQRVTLCIFSGLLGVACSPILSKSFERMGCEPVLNLEATPDEAVSIICTLVDKIILLTFWGRLM
jgi:hypothetical protein